MSGADPSLKCVIAWSDRRNLCSLVEEALRKIASEEVIRVGEDALVVHSARDPAALRDQAREVLGDGESVIVLEFERWSGYGPGIDSTWLLQKGH